MLATIVFDCNLVFTSTFWKELFKLQGFQLQMNSSYHPQKDGQTKAMNRSSENYLRPQPTLPPLTDDGYLQPNPKPILARRLVKARLQPTGVEFLV